jgi:hypothetical protein
VLALGAARLVRADAGDYPRLLVGLLRAGLGRLVVLGPGRKRFLITLAFRQRLLHSLYITRQRGSSATGGAGSIVTLTLLRQRWLCAGSSGGACFALDYVRPLFALFTVLVRRRAVRAGPQVRQLARFGGCYCEMQFWLRCALAVLLA